MLYIQREILKNDGNNWARGSEKYWKKKLQYVKWYSKYTACVSLKKLCKFLLTIRAQVRKCCKNSRRLEKNNIDEANKKVALYAQNIGDHTKQCQRKETKVRISKLKSSRSAPKSLPFMLKPFKKLLGGLNSKQCSPTLSLSRSRNTDIAFSAQPQRRDRKVKSTHIVLILIILDLNSFCSPWNTCNHKIHWFIVTEGFSREKKELRDRFDLSRRTNPSRTSS